jgi:hypothetical protein
VVVIHCWCAAPAVLPSRPLARRCECILEPFRSASRIPQEADADPEWAAEYDAAGIEIEQLGGVDAHIAAVLPPDWCQFLDPAGTEAFGAETVHHHSLGLSGHHQDGQTGSTRRRQKRGVDNDRQKRCGQPQQRLRGRQNLQRLRYQTTRQCRARLQRRRRWKIGTPDSGKNWRTYATPDARSNGS